MRLCRGQLLGVGGRVDGDFPARGLGLFVLVLHAQVLGNLRGILPKHAVKGPCGDVNLLPTPFAGGPVHELPERLRETVAHLGCGCGVAQSLEELRVPCGPFSPCDVHGKVADRTGDGKEGKGFGGPLRFVDERLGQLAQLRELVAQPRKGRAQDPASLCVQLLYDFLRHVGQVNVTVIPCEPLEGVHDAGALKKLFHRHPVGLGTLDAHLRQRTLERGKQGRYLPHLHPGVDDPDKGCGDTGGIGIHSRHVLVLQPCVPGLHVEGRLRPAIGRTKGGCPGLPCEARPYRGHRHLPKGGRFRKGGYRPTDEAERPVETHATEGFGLLACHLRRAHEDTVDQVGFLHVALQPCIVLVNPRDGSLERTDLRLQFCGVVPVHLPGRQPALLADVHPTGEGTLERLP